MKSSTVVTKLFRSSMAIEDITEERTSDSLYALVRDKGELGIPVKAVNHAQEAF